MKALELFDETNSGQDEESNGRRDEPMVIMMLTKTIMTLALSEIYYLNSLPAEYQTK